MTEDKKKIEHFTLDLYKIDPMKQAPMEECFPTREVYQKEYDDFIKWKNTLGDRVSYGARIEILDHVPLTSEHGRGLCCLCQSAWLNEDEALNDLGKGIAQQVKNLLDHAGASFPEKNEEARPSMDAGSRV